MSLNPGIARRACMHRSRRRCCKTSARTSEWRDALQEGADVCVCVVMKEGGGEDVAQLQLLWPSLRDPRKREWAMCCHGGGAGAVRRCSEDWVADGVKWSGPTAADFPTFHQVHRDWQPGVRPCGVVGRGDGAAGGQGQHGDAVPLRSRRPERDAVVGPVHACARACGCGPVCTPGSEGIAVPACAHRPARG